MVDDVGRAALAGMLRGGAAGAVYALCVGVLIAVEDRGRGLGEAALAGLLVGSIVLLVAGLVGLVAGLLLGPACLPLARWLPPPAAALVAGGVVGGLGLLLFPGAVLGQTGPPSAPDRLVYTVLPAALAATAAGRHALLLARRP